MWQIISTLLWLPLILATPKYSPEFFSQIINNSNLSTTSPCHRQLKEFIANLDTNTSWARQMLDASSKIPMGSVTLNFEDLGDFQQCIETRASTTSEEIFGKYCLAGILISDETHLRLRNATWLVPPTWAICLPNGCTQTDTDVIASAVLSGLLESEIIVKVFDSFCQTKEEAEPKVTAGAFFTIIILLFLSFSVLFCTFYDLYNPKSRWMIIKGLSLSKNGKRIFKMEKPAPQHLPFLDGLRFFCMLWVILYHHFVATMSGPLANTKDLLNWNKKFFSVLLAAADEVVVHSFLTIGGVLISYGFMNSRTKKVPFSLVGYYCHRYLRLTTSFSVVVLISATLIPYIGSGPFWPHFLESNQQNCQNYWWSTFLYIQNYVNPMNLCLGPSWYLNVDMQLYLISPILLFGLSKYPKITVTFLTTCILASVGTAFYVSYRYELTVLLFGFFGFRYNIFFSKYYLPTHIQCVSWIIGLILGYVIFKQRQQEINLKLDKYVVFIIWCICFGTITLCIFSAHHLFAHQFDDYNVWHNALHGAFGRPLWSLATGWIILACANNNGGVIQRVLSHPIHQVFSKFTYSMYLIHYLVVGAISHRRKWPFYFGDFDILYEMWGILWITSVLAVLLVFFVEFPVLSLEKELRRKSLSPLNGGKDVKLS